MPNPLKRSGNMVERALFGAWERLSYGWRALCRRSVAALPLFWRDMDKPYGLAQSDIFPHWNLLAGDVEETEKEVLVRLEAPGLKVTDCNVLIKGNSLCLSSEKQCAHDMRNGSFRGAARTHWAFRRTFSLPCYVDAAGAKASYRNGVLTISLQKMASNSRN